jgi:hypothetical protein
MIVVFLGTYFINIGTFRNIAGLTSASPSALWTLHFIFAAAFVLIYFCFQIFLVITTFEDRWPIGIIISCSRRTLGCSLFHYLPGIILCIFTCNL